MLEENATYGPEKDDIEHKEIHPYSNILKFLYTDKNYLDPEDKSMV